MPIRLNREEYKQIDETLDPKKVNIQVLIWSIFLLFGLFLAYGFVWGIGSITGTLYLILLPTFLVLITIHELIHALGYVYVGKARWTDVKFGILWKQLMPYAHCKVPMRIEHYRIAVLAPIVLGVAPLGYAFLFGNYLFFMVGTIMTLTSLGDVLIIRSLRTYQKGVYVQDHESQIGCMIYVRKVQR
ncbi:DUF3267 domain-containing protein [Alteribacter aurantiacus]|uniref:DUF3267 domain-containing protein n=1 Tax=Alteribacter aurantiacus TaxID=254410 RepID=UPI00041C5861|nr:DUF3267 domain-containing protein [Alteribacter aurantiacus]